MNAISGKVIHRILLAHILFSVCLTITARELGKDDGKEVIAAGEQPEDGEWFYWWIKNRTCTSIDLSD